MNCQLFNKYRSFDVDCSLHLSGVKEWILVEVCTHASWFKHHCTPINKINKSHMTHQNIEQKYFFRVVKHEIKK